MLKVSGGPLFRALWLSLGLACAWPAIAQDRREAGPYPALLETRSAGGNARIEVLGQGFAEAGGVAFSQSRLVLYRAYERGTQDALSVFIQGRYHASLVEGAHSEACLPPGVADMGVRRVRVGDGGKDGVEAALRLPMPAGQTVYLKLTGQGTEAVLQPMPAEQARHELQNSRRQLHTVSRIAQPCEPAAPVAQAAVTPTRPKDLVILADSLFVFGRGDRAGLTPEGIRTLEALFSRIENEFSRIESVQVVGHADPLGQAHFNAQLAQQRAHTIRQSLLDTGRITVPIAVEGRGDREPVVTGCGLKPTPAAIRCHQPNRRVVIQVTGQQR